MNIRQRNNNIILYYYHHYYYYTTEDGIGKLLDERMVRSRRDWFSYNIRIYYLRARGRCHSMGMYNINIIIYKRIILLYVCIPHGLYKDYINNNETKNKNAVYSCFIRV